jgi:RNA polymerase sigma-70 factor, ECF subfamily
MESRCCSIEVSIAPGADRMASGPGLDYASLEACQLFEACFNEGSTEVWREFIRRFHPLLVSVAKRTAAKAGILDSISVEDLVQEIYLKICATGEQLCKRFSPTCSCQSVFGYMKALAVNTVLDQARAIASRRKIFKSQSDADCLPDFETPANSASRLSISDRKILLRQIERALRRGESGKEAERDRNIFWMYYGQGLTARAIAAIPTLGLTVKGVETVIHRLTSHIRHEMAVSSRYRGRVRGIIDSHGRREYRSAFNFVSAPQKSGRV